MQKIPKALKFYCPPNTPKIVEARNAKFIENNDSSRGYIPQMIQWKETRYQDNTSMNKDTLVIP
jgi:hypothetical protein